MKNVNLKFKVIFLVFFTMFAVMKSNAQKSREDIPEKYKWDLTDIYASDEAWREGVDKLSARLDEVKKFKGTLTKSASNLLEAFQFTTKFTMEMTKLYIYASMNADLDTRVMKYNGMEQEMQQLYSNFSAEAAYMEPEILSADWETINGYIEKEPKLEDYRMTLENMFRMKKHTLSEPEEEIMALSGMVRRVPQSVYSTFANAEMPKPEVTLSDGKTIKIGSAEYGRYRAAANREDRKKVFEAYWNNFAGFRATYGEMLNGNVKSDIFNARARDYKSSLEAALYPNNIPVEVYHSLVENVNKELPAFYRYLKIKKRMLGVDTLRYYDLYAPAVKDVDLKYTYDEATALVLDALEPLGNEYISTVEKAMKNRWIDVYPNEGKRSGAYSNGAFYEGHPYILLNYNDLYNDVSTLAHELGHTMHSYFSNKSQPFANSDYATFVAEVASTFNEVLLFNHVLEEVDDDDVKLSILMNWLDGFKGTLFRQTQFAEFELKIHEVAESGKPLTGDTFTEIYEDIVKRYYGHKDNICYVDDYINMEWAYIPHFYYNFYVYQYSTSFTASIALAEKVMSGDKQALDNYIKFLSSGASDYPIELLKKAGVDMTTKEPFEKTIESMNKVMDEIEKILDKKDS